MSAPGRNPSGFWGTLMRWTGKEICPGKVEWVWKGRFWECSDCDAQFRFEPMRHTRQVMPDAR